MEHSSGFPDSSVGRESACDAEDPSSIPGSGRSAGEGIGYPLQYSLASLAQMVKTPPAMQETCVRSLGWEGPLEKGKATHSSILAWRILWGHKEPDRTEQLALHYGTFIKVDHTIKQTSTSLKELKSYRMCSLTTMESNLESIIER